MTRPDQLPDWFDINAYAPDLRGEADLTQAALAILDRVPYYRWVLPPRPVALDEPTRQAALTALADWAAAPYERLSDRAPWLAILEHCTSGMEGIEAFADCLEQEDREREEWDAAISREVDTGRPPSDGNGQPVGNLWAVMAWMDDNHALIERLEAAALQLAGDHGWQLENVRKALFARIPVQPAAEEQTELPSATGPAAVGNLFEYRIAAYLDLKLWAALTGQTITADRLASALFPYGEYMKEHMRPSRTIGGFVKGLLEDDHFLGLLRRTVESENLAPLQKTRFRFS